MIGTKKHLDLARLACRDDAPLAERHAAAMGLARLVLADAEDPSRPHVVPLPKEAVRPKGRWGFSQELKPLTREQLEHATEGDWVEVDLHSKRNTTT